MNYPAQIRRYKQNCDMSAGKKEKSKLLFTLPNFLLMSKISPIFQAAITYLRLCFCLTSNCNLYVLPIKHNINTEII